MNHIINRKLPCVPIIQFYILLWFHIWRRFCASLSVRVSDSGQPVKCAIKYHTNNPCHILHRFIPEHSTHHFKLLYTPTTIHSKIFLRHPVTYTRKYLPRQNCHILHWYTHAHFTCHCYRTTNPGVTWNLDNNLKGIRNPIPWNQDNPLKGIQNWEPNGIQIQWMIGLTVPT